MSFDREKVWARALEIVDGTKPQPEVVPDSSSYARIPEMAEAIRYGAGCLIRALEYETEAALIRREGYPLATNVTHRAELEIARAEGAARILGSFFVSTNSDWLNVFRVNAVADLESAKAAFAAE